MTMQNNFQDVLDRIKTAQQKPLDDPRLRNLIGLEKSTFSESASATSGLTFYDLELGAKFLYPVLTPLRNMIPRVSGKGGIQASWRAITAINTSGLRFGVSAASRGGVMAVTTQNYTATYKGIGIETSVDFEAQYAGQGFDDIRAIAAKTGLEALMLGEEAMILGGSTTMALGTTPTPTVTFLATGGALAAQTWSVICAALSFDGFLNGSVANGIQGLISQTGPDNVTTMFGGGSAAKSANATVTTTGTTSSILASVSPVRGAAGYAWFWGSVGSETLGAITTINSLIITAPATGTTSASGSAFATDNSTNAYAFDGLIYQALIPASGPYVFTQPTGTVGIGMPLTSDGTGGIVEIDTALKSMWDNYRLSPDTMWVNSQEALNISHKILSGSQSAAQRFIFESSQDMVGGGIMVRTYLNRFSMQGGNVVEIKVHPNMPAGTILMTTKALPYPLAGVGNVMQIRTRQDYYQIEWPLRTRKYEYGVYADEVLQHYFPPSLALITNIGNG